MVDSEKRLYGTYTTVKCSPSAHVQEKMDIVKSLVNRLCTEMLSWEVIPDFDTMQFIVREGENSQECNWYADEKDTKDEKIDHVLAVAIKFEGKLRKTPFDLVGEKKEAIKGEGYEQKVL